MEFNEKVANSFIGANQDGLPGMLGFNITSASPGKMSASFEVKDELITAFGSMHGGVLSAFCDHLLGCVCYPAMKRGQWAATTEFKINLTRPVSGGLVEGNAEIINLGRTQAVVRIDVFNDGKLAAMAQGTVTIRDPK